LLLRHVGLDGMGLDEVLDGMELDEVLDGMA
jgi:hypothetical protein